MSAEFELVPIFQRPARRDLSKSSTAVPLATFADDPLPIVDVPASPLDSKRCIRCQLYYREGENNDSACCFHSGEFVVTYKSGSMAGVTYGRWSCCGNAEEKASPCCRGRHLEDPTTTENLNKFNLNRLFGETPDITDSLSPSIDSIPDEPFENKQFIRNAAGDLFFKHSVSSLDTFSGLCLKYGVRGGELKKANHLFDENGIYSKEIILIPWKKGKALPPPDLTEEERESLERQRKLARFAAECRASREEALYYLEQAKWDFKAAQEERFNDLEFERARGAATAANKSLKC